MTTCNFKYLTGLKLLTYLNVVYLVVRAIYRPLYSHTVHFMACHWAMRLQLLVSCRRQFVFFFFRWWKTFFSSADSESQNPFYFVSPRNIFSIARLLGKGKDAEVAIWHGLGCLPPRTKVQMDGNFYFKKFKKKRVPRKRQSSSLQATGCNRRTQAANQWTLKVAVNEITAIIPCRRAQVLIFFYLVINK